MPKETNKRMVTAAILISTFLAAIEGTIVTTAVPKMVSDLGGLELISWVASVYLLTSAVTTPIFGKMADLYGRKIVFTIGAVVFLIGSMLSGMAQTMAQLIVFRALQGIGAGGILPITFTIVGDIYPFKERARVQGWISGMWGIAGILGPVTGGVLVDYVSWRWVFYMNVPFGLVAIVMLWLSLHEQIEKEKKPVDYWGVLTFTIGMTALIYALLSGGTTYPWQSGFIIGCFAIAFVAMSVFFAIETKVREPMLPLHLFKNRFISVSILAGLLLGGILVAVDFYIPLWIQGVYGMGALESGLTLIPMSISWPLGAALSGRLIGHLGLRKTTLLGMVCVFVGVTGLAFLNMAMPHVVLYVIALVLGFGFGIVMTSYTVTVQSAVDWQLRGTALGSNQFMRTLGQTIGIVVFGAIFNLQMAGYLSRYGQDVITSGDVDVNEALHPEVADKLPPDVLQTVREAIAFGLHDVFFWLTILAAAVFLLSFLLPKHEGHAE